MMDHIEELADLIWDKFLWPETWYSIQDNNGSYHFQTGYSGTPLLFSKELLKKHLMGQLTCAVQPTHFKSRKCKFGGIDFDFGGEPNRDNLTKGLTECLRVAAEAVKNGLKPYVEYSGRRGFHLYLFPDIPVLSSVMRGALKTLLHKANIHSDEIFPFSDSISADYKPKGIKLPPAKHRLGVQSGFIDPQKLEWEGDYIKVPENQISIIANFESSPSDRLIELALEQPAKAAHQNVEADWTQLEGHPKCIETLLSGVPASMEYNKANMTLVRYGFSKNLSDKEILALGYQMASKSNRHPSSKATPQAKLDNLKSVLYSMDKNRNSSKTAWSCSYLFAEKDLRKQCLFCPIQGTTSSIGPKLEITRVDQLAEQELIGYIMAHPDQLSETLDQMVFADCFLSEEDVDGKMIPLPSIIFEAMDGIETDLRPSTLLAHLPDNMVEPGADYLTKIMEMPVCSYDTFILHCQRIRENGLRLEAARLAEESIGNILDRKKPIEYALDSLATRAEHLHTKQSVGMIRPMSKNTPALLEELMSDKPICVPTRSEWANDILNGGWGIKRLYAIAAPPGAGKTTFLNSEADYAAECGYPVIEIQFEMSESQLWYYSLSRISGINSRIIERKKFLDPSFFNREEIEKSLSNAVLFHHEKIGPRFFIHEADETTTPSVLKGYIKQVRSELNLPEDFPVLVIVDYLQLMQSGVKSLDESTNQTLRVSRVASALTRVARSTNSAILAISDITKEAYKKAMESGKMDMGALKDSFTVAHAAHGVAILQAGKVAIQSKRNEKPEYKDQIELLAGRYEEKSAIKDAILSLKGKYPLNWKVKAQYAVLSWVKLRGSILGTPAYIYEKAIHRYIPMKLDGTLLEDLSNDD